MSSSPVLNAAEKLSVSERVAYGLGDMASNLSFGAVSLFLLFFYTNVFGLSTIEASAIFLIARVIDAIYNLLLGYVVDKTHTRHGKLRPYLLYGAIPLGMLTMLCFSTPETQHKFAYALITYTLYCLAYTTVNTPYSGLNNMLTQHVASRSSLSVYRMIFATLGYFSVSVCWSQLVAMFPSPKLGSQVAIAIFSTAATLMFFICFGMTRERVVQDESAKPDLSQMTTAVLGNRPLMLVSLFTLSAFIAYSLWMAAAIYYISYVMKVDNYISTFFATQTIASTIGVAISGIAKARLGKRKVAMLMLAIVVVALLSQYLFTEQSLTSTMICISLYSMGLGCVWVCLYAMVADTVEYSEWKYEVRAEGAIYGFFNFVTKVAMAVGAGLAGLLLNYAGYDTANVTQRAVDWINLMMTLIPAGLYAISFSFVLRNTFDEKAYLSILEKIAERKRGLSETHPLAFSK